MHYLEVSHQRGVDGTSQLLYQTIIWLRILTPTLVYAEGGFDYFCSAAGDKDIMVVFGKRSEQNQIGLEIIYVWNEQLLLVLP